MDIEWLVLTMKIWTGETKEWSPQLSICHGNSDKITTGLQHCVCEERACRMGNKSSPTTPYERFWSWLESEDWVIPAKIWQRHSSFGLNSCKDKEWQKESSTYWTGNLSRLFFFFLPASLRMDRIYKFHFKSGLNLSPYRRPKHEASFPVQPLILKI